MTCTLHIPPDFRLSEAGATVGGAAGVFVAVAGGVFVVAAVAVAGGVFVGVDVGAAPSAADLHQTAT